MKQFALFLFMLLVAKLVIGQTPKQTVEGKIHQVETSLMPPLQLTDEPPIRFNLIDRIRHYHIPAVSIDLVNNSRIRSISHTCKWPDFKSVIKKTIRLLKAAMAWHKLHVVLSSRSRVLVKKYGDLFTFDLAVDSNITSVNYVKLKWINVK